MSKGPPLTEHNSEHLCRLPLLLLRQPPSDPLLGDPPFVSPAAALPPPLTPPHAVLQGGGAGHQGGARDGAGMNRGGSNRDGQGDPCQPRVGGGLGSRGRSQALLGPREEATRLHFEGVDHCLFHQGLTHKERGRRVGTEVGVGGPTEEWTLHRNDETKAQIRWTFMEKGNRKRAGRHCRSNEEDRGTFGDMTVRDSPLFCVAGQRWRASGSGCTTSHPLVVYTCSEREGIRNAS